MSEEAVVADGDDDQRSVGTRYRIDEEGGRWWEVGWDGTLGTFYGQRFEREAGAVAERPVGWVGARVGEVGTVVQLAQLVGHPLPDHIWQELEADRTAHPFDASSGRVSDILRWAGLGVDELRPVDHADHVVAAPSTPGGNESGRVPPRPPGQEVVATGYGRSGVVVSDPRTGVRIFYPLDQWESFTAAAPYDDRLVLYPTFEQVTRPSVYALVPRADASPGPGVDIGHASAATVRMTDPDRGDYRTADIELVRLSVFSDGRAVAGRDVWLRQDPTTQTWELADDPRAIPGSGGLDVVPALQPGRHTPPDLWTLEHEIRAIEAYVGGHRNLPAGGQQTLPTHGHLVTQGAGGRGHDSFAGGVLDRHFGDGEAVSLAANVLWS